MYCTNNNSTGQFVLHEYHDISLCTQISTENNVAYGEVTRNQDGNDLYEIMDPPIEDSTTQFAQDGRSGEYTTEYYYDYVN